MDEHVSKAVVKGLRERGVDVLTVSEAGMMGAADKAHLQFAKQQKRVIFTQDTDFLRLHASGEEHNGIVYAHQKTSTGDIIFGLMLISELLSPDEMTGHIEFV